MDRELAIELLNEVIETWYKDGNIGSVEVSYLDLVISFLESLN